MELDPALFFENMCLYYFQNKCIKKVKKTDNGCVRCCGNAFRFIDDLTTPKNCVRFERSFRQSYTPVLKLSKENRAYLEREKSM